MALELYKKNDESIQASAIAADLKLEVTCYLLSAGTQLAENASVLPVINQRLPLPWHPDGLVKGAADVLALAMRNFAKPNFIF